MQQNGSRSTTNSGEPRYARPPISAFMHIFGDMPGNIISRAGFSQPFVILFLQFLMTTSAVAKMALGLLEVTENHDSQHLSLVY